jgi:hypothetical protein
MPDKPGALSIVQAVARYLRDHPQASDTSEGIAQWWLAPALQPSLAEVEAALQWLEAHGVVESLHAADGRVRWRARTQVDALRERLDAIAGPDDPIADDPSGSLH